MGRTTAGLGNGGTFDGRGYVMDGYGIVDGADSHGIR